MTEEPAEPDGGGPTEADVEAAKEELEAVGRDDPDETADADRESAAGEESAEGEESADEDLGGEDSGGETPDDEDPGGETPDDEDPDDGTGDDAGVDGAEGADGDAEPVDDGAGDDATESDDAEDDGTHAEDLVEDPAGRSVGGTDLDVTATAGGAAVEQVEPDDADEPDDEREATGGEDDGPAEDDATAGDGETATEDAGSDDAAGDGAADGAAESDRQDHQPGVPADVQKYDRFQKVDGAQYDRVNEFLRDRTYVTAREWAIARLCSDFRTETGVEMTKIGENLPELVPFMTDTYTAQAVNQARSSFEDKVRTAGATFLYGAMCDFFTAEELDDVMYEATEVAKFLLEVEGVELSVEEELEAEDRISAVMRDVRESSAELRHESCPECGARLTGDD